MAGLNIALAFWLPDPEHSAAAKAVLVGGYLAAAACWLRAGQRARRVARDSFARWWLLGGALLFALALNKLFGLRRVFEAGFRSLAKSEGWYDRRQFMQFVLAVVLPAVLAVATAIFLAVKARPFIRCHRLALVGWCLLLLYLAVRQTQEWKPILPWLEAVRYYDWRLALESAGIALVIFAAVRWDSPPPAQSQ